MILTEVAFDAAGDTYVPPFDRAPWRVVERRPGDRAEHVKFERVAQGPNRA